MENRRQVGTTTTATTRASSLDHLFGPKNSSSSSSSTSSGILGSIFPPPSKVPAGRDPGRMGQQEVTGSGKYVNQDNVADKAKGEGSGKDKDSVYQNEKTEPSYFSSSIYYGGQENYSPRTKNPESQHVFKRDDNGEDNLDGNNPDSASRGNWWQGSLYY